MRSACRCLTARPSRSVPTSVRSVAQRAEALGFRDLWVTENTLDHVFCFDPVAVLTYAAAVTTTIRLGARSSCCRSITRHMWPTNGHVSTMSAAGARSSASGSAASTTMPSFCVPREARVRRFREEVAVDPGIVERAPRYDFRGRLYQLEGGTMAAEAGAEAESADMVGGRPPRRRASRRPYSPTAGWARAGRASPALSDRCRSCARRWRRPGAIRRAFRSRSGCSWRSTSGRRARAAESHRWFTEVYHNPEGTDASGIHGTPEQVRERLEELVAMGANHLLLNPVSRYAEQVEALAAVAGLT